MSNIITASVEELTELVNTTWSDLTIIFRSNQIQRQNWNNLIDEIKKASSAGFGVPYAVIDIGTIVPDENFQGLHNSAKNVPVSIYYITEQKSTAQAIIEQRLADLMKSLEGSHHTSFQVTTLSSADFSPGNPANQVFYSSDVPLVAGYVSCNLLIGESITF